MLNNGECAYNSILLNMVGYVVEIVTALFRKKKAGLTQDVSALATIMVFV